MALFHLHAMPVSQHAQYPSPGSGPLNGTEPPFIFLITPELPMPLQPKVPCNEKNLLSPKNKPA